MSICFFSTRSHSFVCPDCGKISFELAKGVSKPATEEEKSMINCVAFKVMSMLILRETMMIFVGLLHNFAISCCRKRMCRAL